MLTRTLLVFITLSLSQFFSAQPLVNNNYISIADYGTFLPLEEYENEVLEIDLLSHLNENSTYRKLIRNKKLSVGLVDMRDVNDVKFASVNGNHMMYAASLPKIAVLLAAMDAIEKGELRKTPEVETDMNLMIRKSNNAASTRMIDRVGFQKIADVMQDPRYGLYDRKDGGGLWVGKRYAAKGARNPDPLKGLSHAATVDKVCSFYYMLANDELVSPERSKEMRAIMTAPGLQHKFVNTIKKIAPYAKLYRKSGSWRTFHSDSIWVKGTNRNYILVALVDDPNGEQIIRDLVNVAEKALNQNRILAEK